jgi:hypothetical protein
MHKAHTSHSEFLTKERELLAVELVVAGWIFNSKRLYCGKLGSESS